MMQPSQNGVSVSEAACQSMPPPLPRPPKAVARSTDGSKSASAPSSSSEKTVAAEYVDKKSVVGGNLEHKEENYASVNVDEIPESACKKSSEEDNLPNVEAEDPAQRFSAQAMDTKAGEGADVVPVSQLYSMPAWSHAPGHPYILEVLKEGSVIEVLNVSQKAAYMFGRSDRCDFILEHPSSSRYHAVLQYNNKGEAFVFDLGSTHGTFVNKRQVKSKIYAPLHVGDVFRFGLSSRLYVLQGPTELMPEEGLSKVERTVLRKLEAAQEREEQEASILRAKRDAMDFDGITWGMEEDAVEQDDEVLELEEVIFHFSVFSAGLQFGLCASFDNFQEVAEEVIWQNYGGQLTDNQQKTLEKIHKRNEKLANLKKENDAIQSKEISQGGLTQGQQTQMARNEQRIEQLLEELESLEETLNESIQESIGTRSQSHRSFKKKGYEEEEEELSDDEFYDRTSKKRKMDNKGGMEAQKVETVDSLLLKKEELVEEIESVLAAIEVEVNKEICNKQQPSKQEAMDSLDVFMTSVSSEIVKSSTARLEKDQQRIQAEIDRVTRLLKIADPTGEATEKWAAKSSQRTSNSSLRIASSIKPTRTFEDHKKGTHQKISDEAVSVKSQSKQLSELDANQVRGLEPAERIASGGTIAPENSLWLGAPRAPAVTFAGDVSNDEDSAVEKEQFLEYRDRRHPDNASAFQDRETKANAAKVTGTVENREDTSVASLQHKEVIDEKQEVISGKLVDENSSELEDVALLLKYEKGLSAVAGENQKVESSIQQKRKAMTKEKRVLGPERPAFLKHKEGQGPEYDSWLPPEGQTGDGRTLLNEKYGY
ncbi:hypothetical protein O6H91_03G088700 [Diphasiastrum complanatum]|uniref:Uncharacterized protein n=1 Tax=Diphasiastrum complanatum TaxID=34168 RepID=A0ACC2E967_DIPCM|nr:hypothetical protein O6H91_03G088700 [Diphasiastrum complanatum]